MKRTFFILILIATTIIANAQKYQTPEQRAKLEAKHGIRDIKLDTPKSRYNDLYEVKNEFPCGQMMQRTNENLYIDKLKLESIRYLYISDTLKAISINFDSSRDTKNFDLMVAILEKLYGPVEEKRYEPYFESTSGCSWYKEYAWYADSFLIETQYYGFDRKITFIKNDLYKKCSKFSGQEKP